MREMLVPIFQNGECVYQLPTVKEVAYYCKSEKETLWEESMRFVNPQEVYVDLSQPLFDLKTSLLQNRKG